MTQAISLLQPLLDIPFISRVRRNHGLEHATLNILSEHHPKLSLGGHSDGGGFWIVGNVETADLQEAVHQALTRMRSGEAELAVHPNCGTNFVTAGAMAGVAASFVMITAGKRLRDKLERLPVAISMATLALMVAQPVGLNVQANITTSGVPGMLEVDGVMLTRERTMRVHRVLTHG
jgi:hypothetical protein